MLPILKWRRGLYSLFILALLSAMAPTVASAADDEADRYRKVWERNPYTLVSPALAQVRITPFDKLILVSWLDGGGKDVVFVQNSDTSEVQKVTKHPNPNNLRLVEIHKNADPKKGRRHSLKWRRFPAAADRPQPAGRRPASRDETSQIVPGAVPGVPVPPGTGMTRQMQMQQNAQALQQAARVGAAQIQPENGRMPPRASEVRRKRITPPPPNEQPVDAPAPYKTPSNQSPPQ
jgi:hypothetical protein